MSSAIGDTTYTLAGLRIISDMRLSGLLLCDATPKEVVTIRLASVPEALSGPVRVQDGVAYNGKALLLTISEVVRFLVSEGSEILVDPEPSANKNDIRAFLLGSAFGTLCHQRGILPLHSAAIDVADGCIAIIGPSGAGKSTLAASLAARGHQVIADDVSFLQRDNDGVVRCWPGIGRIRLWEDAVTALGCNGPGVEREFRGYNKYLIPVPPPKAPFASRRLRRIYHLNAALSGDAASINRVRGASAIELLMQNVYRMSLAEFMGRKADAFAICAAIAAQIPVFQFRRPLGFDVLREGIDILEDHLRDIC